MHHENTVCTRQQSQFQHKAGKQYCLRGLDQFCVKPGLKTEGISILFRIFLACFLQLSDFSVTSHIFTKWRKKTHLNCHIWAEFHNWPSEWWIIKQILNILSGVYKGRAGLFTFMLPHLADSTSCESPNHLTFETLLKMLWRVFHHPNSISASISDINCQSNTSYKNITCFILTQSGVVIGLLIQKLLI